MRRGLTLIELLVAVILCGIVVFIAVQVLRGEHKNYTVTREKVRLQSDAREGMRILEEEIKNAGYRTNASIPPSTRVLTATPCDEALYGTTGASFDPAPSASVYTHASATGNVDFEMRFYPWNRNGIDCTNDLWTVGYKYDNASKMVYRQVKLGNPATHPLVASDWAPFLENVKSFSLEYGLLQTNDVLLEPSTMTFTGASDWLFNNATMTSDAVDAAHPWVVATQSGLPITVVYLARALTKSGNAVDGARNEGLDDKATYRITFNVSANSDFFDDAMGLASAIGGATSKYVTAGFYDAGGVPRGPSGALSTFTFRPVSGAIHAVQYDLKPVIQPGQENDKVYFGINFQLKAAATSDRKLTISGLKIVRLNKGQYAFQSSVTDAQRKAVQAIRVTMQSSQHNELLNFERIIPMVNNGL